MREPSIHVRRKDLLMVLNQYCETTEDEVNIIIADLRKVSCDSRSITITNDKLKNDIERRLKSNKGDASLMAEIIHSVRIKLKHRGVRRITPNDRDWLQVKQLANLGNQFAGEFNLETREAYIKYVEIGLKKLSSMRAYVSKLINMYETICNEYGSQQDLFEDNTQEDTKEVHDLFINKIADKTGIYESYLNNPTKMLAFFKVKKLCNELGVDYEIFINAQFEALEWCNGLPTPEMLIGDKAKERLNKYMFNHGELANKPKKVKAEFWQQLKNKSTDE